MLKKYVKNMLCWGMVLSLSLTYVGKADIMLCAQENIEEDTDGNIEEETEENDCMSGIPSRPYCKGRNYDPNRYASGSTEE